MLRATLKGLLARKLRLALSALSVVLGVAFVAGAFVLTDTLQRTFDGLFTTIYAGTAVEVRGAEAFSSDNPFDGGSRAQVPDSALATVRALPGVAEVAGGVSGYAQLVGRDGKAVSVGANAPAIGQAWTGTGPLSALHLVSGRGPEREGEIAIDRGAALAADYAVGDRVTVLTQRAPVTETVVGTFTFGDSNSLAGATITSFDPGSVRRVLGLEDGYATVDVAAAPGVSQAVLAARVRTALGPGYEVQTGEEITREQTDSIDRGLGFFTTFLLVFAAISLFVGAFIIVNTFSMLISQRVRELGLLRALGASRRQVTRSVLTEAVAVGAVGGVVGLGVGLLLALGLQQLLEAIGIDLPGGGLVVRPRTVVVSLLVGVLVTLVAALAPARRAGTIPPIAALRDGGELGERSLRRRAVAGLALLLGGVALLAAGLAGGGGGAVTVVGLGVLLGFVGVAVLSPFIASPVVRVLALLLRPVLGAPGRLGTRNALRNPRRTAATAAALTVGIALVSAFAVIGASVKTTLRDTLVGSLSADAVVTSTAAGQGVPTADEQALRTAPGVGALVGVRSGAARVGDRTTTVTGLPTDYDRAVRLRAAAGSLRLGDDALLVADAEATDRDLHVGDRVAVRFPRGDALELTVGGTFAANGAVDSYVVSAAALAAGSPPGGDTVVYLRAADGTSAASLVAAAAAAVRASPTAKVQDRAAYEDDLVGQVDVLLNLVTVLLLLSIVIAALGIVNTLALSVVERTREIGLLRAVGLTRPQLRSSVRVEAVLIAVYGGVLGIVVGTLLGVALTEALDVDALTVPVVQLAVYVVLAALIGVVAAVLPARRAARLAVLDAIATA